MSSAAAKIKMLKVPKYQIQEKIKLLIGMKQKKKLQRKIEWYVTSQEMRNVQKRIKLLVIPKKKRDRKCK